MPAHLKKRGGYWYVVDGPFIKSCKTTKRGYAEAELRRYNEGLHGVERVPTVKERYEAWIKEIEPTARRSRVRDYKQAFKAYILPRFKNRRLTEIDTGAIARFKDELIRQGKKEKWVRNIVDCSFRAFYRDARGGCKAIQGRDPFMDIRWERVEYDPPEPFTAQERDRILMHFGEHEPWYYPFVRFQFETGARPSESVALTWADLNAEACTVRINKSRHLGSEGLPKTPKSRRTIIISAELMDLLQASRFPIWGDSDKVFHNKKGTALTTDYFRKDYWTPALETLGIRKLKLYATRHTFITEKVKAGENLLAIAQYAGTSLQMIQSNYCGPIGFQTKIEQATGVSVADANYINSLGVASPTGFEPVSISLIHTPQSHAFS